MNLFEGHASPRPVSPSGGARAALLLLVLLLTGGALAESEPILVDRIVAIVDEEAILQSDVDREVELYRLEREYAGQPITESDEEVRREVLERLMESKLIIAAAKQADMSVDEEAIGESVEAKIQQFVEHFGSMEKLREELGRSGMTLDDYRARMSSQLRDQQYMRLVVGRFIRPDLEVLDNEVRDYFESHRDEMPSEPDSVTIANILIPVQPGEAVRQQVQQTVARVQAGLQEGLAFEDLARQYSRGPNAARGGAVGVFSRGDLFDPALDQAIFSLPEGQVSEPVVSSRGVHIVKVDRIQADGRRAFSQVFLPVEITEADMQAARQRMDEARDRILGGESFAVVAAELSVDPVSAPRGGRLGTFSLPDLSTQFQEALAEVPAGQLSEPVLTPAGWYLFLMESRTPGHVYTFDELKDNLRQVVEGEKIEQALEDYVDGLKERFFIDEKI